MRDYSGAGTSGGVECRPTQLLRLRHGFAMKTTLDLDEQLLQEAEACAAREGRTLAQLVEEALRSRVRASAAPDNLNFLVKLGWLTPGIDIDNRNALYDLFDDLP